jgi:nitroreductase
MTTPIKVDAHAAWGPESPHAPSRQLIEWALECATLAPSPRDTQPWLFRVDGDAVEILADRSRALAVADPRHRELIMSCGAALSYLRVALRASGWGSRVVRAPFERNPDLVARVEIGERVDPTASDAALLSALLRRRTNDLAFTRSGVTDSAARELCRAAGGHGAELVIIGDLEARHRIASLVSEGQRRQRENPRFGREAETRGQGRETGPGGTPSASGLAEASPAMGVLLTDWEGPPEWVAAGQALAQVLLRAEASGLAASFLNQPLQDHELRARLRRALGERGFPQALLRLGRPLHEAPEAVRRRPLEDVVL